MKTKTERISNDEIRVVRCAGNHAGNHRLAVTSDRRHCECQGCGSHYSAEEVHDAISGRTAREMGQGGVTTH